MEESQLRSKIIEWLTLRGEVASLEKARSEPSDSMQRVDAPVMQSKHPQMPGQQTRDAKQKELGQVLKVDEPPREDIVAGVKVPFLLHEHKGIVPHDHPHRELAAKFVSDVWKKNKHDGMRMSQRYLGIGQEPSAPEPVKKDMQVSPAGTSEPMMRNTDEQNSPRTINGPALVNPYRNIFKNLQSKKVQR